MYLKTCNNYEIEMGLKWKNLRLWAVDLAQ